MYESVNEELLDFLNESPDAFHAADQIRRILKQNGFEELAEGNVWNLAKGGKYFVLRNESSVIAFAIPKTDFQGFMIGAAHSDSPSFKIKENPEIKKEGYITLNVEKYGGMLMSTWFDRPLSVAGRVLVRDGNRIMTKLVNVDRDLVQIVNLAIHMDRTANSGHEINVQNEMEPILGLEGSEGSFMKIIAEAAGVKPEDILGHDLFLYQRGKGTIWGANHEFLSAGHLDDLQCAFGCLQGFLHAAPENSIPLLAIFDNEEVGSGTKQGADSTFLEDVVRRICTLMGKNTEDTERARISSFMVSADNAHAVHPNYASKADPVNRPKINEGIVIKYNANQRYTTDAVSAAVFREVCRKAEVPLQEFTNRSDMAGGSTLGNISNSHFSLNTVDIGLPQMAMHSCWETAGTKDTAYLAEAMQEFFSSSFRDLGGGSWELD